MTERALTLKQAAALLGVSYSTIYAHKEEMGFFQVGNQWRVWPDKLKSATEYNPNGQHRDCATLWRFSPFTHRTARMRSQPGHTP